MNICFHQLFSIRLWTGIFGFLSTLVVSAQHVETLTLEQALVAVEKGNAQIRVSEIERRISAADHRSTDAVFLPQVSLGYTAMVTDNPLNAFGFLLQQRNVSQADFNPAVLNHPSAADLYNVSLDVKMPIFNLDMIYARKGAKAMEKVNAHKAEYTRRYIRFETQKAYTQLQFAHCAKSVLELALSDVRRIHETVLSFEKQGLMQRSDVLNAQVQVNTIEAALANAESNITSASEGLALLMGEKQVEGMVYATDSLMPLASSADELVFSPHRADLRALEAASEATDWMARSAQSAFIPKVNAFGTFQLNNGKPFAFKNEAYMMGINLTWNLFQGTQNIHKTRSALLKSEKMREELKNRTDQIRTEVDKNRRDLVVSDFEIRKHGMSVAQAEEALRIIRHRFDEGLASTTDLLQAQAQLSQQRLGRAQAVMQHNIAHYYRQLITSSH